MFYDFIGTMTLLAYISSHLRMEIDNQSHSYHNSDKKYPLDCFQVVNVSAQYTLGI